ncbi:homeobox protein engrailed-like SMOX-2 [Manihot esculenta]|uniref:Homeobox domain-containing protein n=3 Tax=Manihot esculenta TaxID=3983 RepID=A0A2C9V8V6_MANES|nr:homeobox protein engrailed-like SMOX-2 [Manihot esculenta]KAG8646861.1 hypothetical protein MANES_09G036600v8 [Manihot esculenta]KAG8646862.1 hypothetical protein MANES_09G036600v8 [Manihot esculenta]OAY40618.1 hypothetical protein MANES_09G036600v8 [Manihot esculenta]
MAETSHSVTRAAATLSSMGAAQHSNMDFWYDVYTKNQEDSVVGPSRLDYEWGYVFGNSSPKTKKRKKDVGSTSTACSNSDLSEALSAISAHLSLSSSGSSSREGDQYQDTDKDVAGFMKNHAGIPQDETLDNSMENCSSFDTHSMSSESDEDDELSSNSNEDEMQAEGTQKDHFQVPELGTAFSSEGEAYEFYSRYAKGIGFIVRKGKVRRSSNGDIRERFFFCSREGFRSKKQANKLTKFKRKETRTGCRARMRCTVENGKWVISQFSQKHNHQLYGFTKTSEPNLASRDEATVAKDAGAVKYFEFAKMDFMASERVSTEESDRGFDINRLPVEEAEEGAALSSPNSGMSSFRMDFGIRSSGGGRCNKRDTEALKKLRLSKEQSAFLEESFKEHSTVNPKQRLALARQFNLRYDQVELWFGNRRASTKLKQAEVDSEFLKRCCQTLTEENRRLQKELQELRALKAFHLPDF